MKDPNLSMEHHADVLTADFNTELKYPAWHLIQVYHSVKSEQNADVYRCISPIQRKINPMIKLLEMFRAFHTALHVC